MKTYTEETFPGCDTCKWCINVGNELHPSLYCKNIKSSMRKVSKQLTCIYRELIEKFDELRKERYDPVQRYI